jgi:formate dehydrogenase iron-sulfur subunit
MTDKAVLLDMAKCIACRACQVACKQWNELPAEKTTFFAAAGGYQNPMELSPSTYTLVKFYERNEGDKLRWFFRVHSCMQCIDPACVKACPVEPVKAMTYEKETGAIYVNRELCIGCGECRENCPFHIPVIDIETEKSTKCEFCYERLENGLETACAKACPTDCLVFGDRDQILEMAHKSVERLKAEGRHPVIYGEKELGTGTRKIYVLPEPLDYYPDLPKDPKVSEDIGLFHEFMNPPSSILTGLGLVFGGVSWVANRKKKIMEGSKSEKVD